MGSRFCCNWKKQLNLKKLNFFFDNEKVADIPVNTLVENSPMYDRKWKKAKLPKKLKSKKKI
jgi:phosphoribosylformylglycinamidine (FGAM) synthase-like enzyme